MRLSGRLTLVYQAATNLPSRCDKPSFNPQFSRLETQFSQGRVPSFAGFWSAHQTAKQGSQFALGRVPSLSMQREHGLSHLFTRLSKTVLFALFPIFSGAQCNHCAFLRKVISELAYTII